MRIFKTIAILLGVPLLGIAVAAILGAFALPPDPNFVSDGGHSAPGDGFLIILYVVFSFFVSIPLSMLIAGVFLFRSVAASKSNVVPQVKNSSQSEAPSC